MNLCPSGCSIEDLSILGDANDERLVAAAKSGEHFAFSELWNRHSKKAFNTMYRITKNQQDAEDALQEAFLKTFLHLKNFDGRSTFSTWFTRIAINSALMILRRKRAHPETSMDWSLDGETWQVWEMVDRRANTEEHYARQESAALEAGDTPFASGPSRCCRNAAIARLFRQGTSGDGGSFGRSHQIPLIACKNCIAPIAPMKAICNIQKL